MSAKHTPGPWAARHLSRQDGNGGTMRFHIMATPDLSVEVCKLKGWDEEDEANARLIASTPELLAQLQELVDRFGHNDSPEDLAALDSARAAITKATEGRA